ncbi:uncharacterized protein LOC120268578 [Dioscorea cayenensis subsp. rotundata]|uniref:Uncharacterized protein LOC120268578 n=1 Tax=Dioscorea cayennensis subsp. rotundata TaxID=55577 RepID=A0AB40BY26_DIOCR|nr:uncharacterized protein LOC120268578 [Dioscorea cayenensis subsp. rotundata]
MISLDGYESHFQEPISREMKKMNRMIQLQFQMKKVQRINKVELKMMQKKNQPQHKQKRISKKERVYIIMMRSHSEIVSQKKKAAKESKRKSFSPEVKGEKPSSSSKKEMKKKATQHPEDSDEDRFLDKDLRRSFESVVERGIVVERVIDTTAFEKYGLTELLKERSLYKSATFVESYSLSLVQEFYSNLLPSDKGISRVFIREKWIPFTPTSLNKFLEFKSEVKGIYEEGLELNEEVLKDITGGRTESWGEQSRLPASTLTAKYNVLFRLGILNWLPIPHNSSIVKELALLLYAVGTGKKFNLRRLIF